MRRILYAFILVAILSILPFPATVVPKSTLLLVDDYGQPLCKVNQIRQTRCYNVAVFESARGIRP